MKRALIATVFNEADNLSRWWECLSVQSERPDEIAIVDGGSQDGTWEKLRELRDHSPIPLKLEQRRCNIAEGRNGAIALTHAEIIAATDAGCFPEADWFREVTRPLLEDPTIDVVGGRSLTTEETDFQRFLRAFEPGYDNPQADSGDFSSSRNIAFRREAWADIGGYPEWLTLTAEDSLFNFQLRSAGKKLFCNPQARVRWQERPTAEAYFKMVYGYGFGAAEAQLYTPYFLRRLLVAVFPPLLLLSQHRFAHFEFRYRKNLSSGLGWVAGKLRGRRPPKGWKRIDGILLSPEAQISRSQNHRC